jgi:proline iminopeptidase
VAEAFARVDDQARLWFVVDGDGPPIVLCHGGPGLWDYLAPVSALLVESARVVRWEQRGCGRSDQQGPYTTARSVADLEHLRSHLGYERWIVGGHSWGATLALQYALAHQVHVVGLAYISGVGLGRAWNAAYHAAADRRLSEAQRARRDELQRRERTVSEEREYRTLCWAPDYADPATAFEHASADASAPFVTNYESNAQLNAESKTWDENELAQRCRDLAVPSLVLHGELDPRPVWALDSLIDALPRREVHVVAGAGHKPWVEAAGVVGAALQGFIRRCAAG